MGVVSAFRMRNYLQQLFAVSTVFAVCFTFLFVNVFILPV